MGLDMQTKEKSPQQEEELASLAALYLYGDVLQSVVSQVPTADLVPASRVSHEWRRAVRAVLHRRPRSTPWLLLQLYNPHRSAASGLHAYDPHSRTWLSLPCPLHVPSHLRFIHCSSGHRLCSMSITGMTISIDPLGATWLQAAAPRVWRMDPVVAAVGKRVVAIGGTCELALLDDEDVRAVEMLDHSYHANGWFPCEPLPAVFSQSAAATWLSAAATERRVYVMEKRTGWAGWFDPETRKWGPTRQLQPDPTVSVWCIGNGLGVEQLVVIGAKQEEQQFKDSKKKVVVVRMWRVDGETLNSDDNTAEEMPRELSEALFPCCYGEDEVTAWSVGMSGGTSTGGYVYNAAVPANGAVYYEVAAEEEKGRIVRRWEWVPPPHASQVNVLHRASFGCSPIGFHELDQVLSLK